jgi:hypothetical protein
MMTSNSPRRATVLACALSSVLWAGTASARASDDFGNIVHHIEARYHVHRNHRFVLGFAGFVVKFWHVAGVKNLKIALFENRRFVGGASDAELDEIVQAAGGSGWQPVVRSYSRHSGEHTFVYAKYLGKDLQLLVVNLERSEAAVVQVELNPDKLLQFIDHEDHGAIRLAGKRHGEAQPSRSETAVEEAADSGALDWHGGCVFLPLKENDLR